MPDLTVYREAMAAPIVGQHLLGIRLRGGFVLCSVTQGINELAGDEVLNVRRLSKQLMLHLHGDVYAVLHLMISVRLH